MPEPPTFIHDLTPQRGPRFVRAEGSYPPPPPPEPPKPRLKKLRLFLVLSGLTILALISTVFGMLMAVASDLPSLDNRAELRAAENSLLFADGPGCKKLDEAIHNSSCRLAKLTGNLNRILVDEGDVSPYLKNAVIAIEDRRFYEHEGVDYTGIARALWQDLRRRQAVQGGSTITQQFVKNALSAQGDRSVFQKLRESALAYHLERKWPKDKILMGSSRPCGPISVTATSPGSSGPPATAAPSPRRRRPWSRMRSPPTRTGVSPSTWSPPRPPCWPG
jgi:hypothetical protein